MEVWLSGLVVPLLLLMLKGTYARAVEINPKTAAQAVAVLLVAGHGTMTFIREGNSSRTVVEGFESDPSADQFEKARRAARRHLEERGEHPWF